MLNEGSIEVDGKTFPNSYKANEYIQKKVVPLQKKLEQINQEKKEIEKQLAVYYKVGEDIEKDISHDVKGSRLRRGAIGKDVDSDTGTEWREKVRKHLYSK